MPGLSTIASNVVVAEIGIDMSRFATPAHLLSWACMCPRNDESAGKRRSTPVAPRRQVAQDHARAGRLVRHQGQGQLSAGSVPPPARPSRRQKAIIGVAASMLTAIWHMLRNGTQWRDLGAAHFDRAEAHKTATRLIHRLQRMGYAVQLTPA